MVIPERKRPTSNAGQINVHEPTPAARIATISLSVPIREKPIVTPAKAASGIVNVRTPGRSVAPIPASNEKGRSV